MKLTTIDLKSKNYTVINSIIGNNSNNCLSKPIIIDFIDEFFNGELEVGLESNQIIYGTAKFNNNLNIDDNFINKYVNHLSISSNLTIKEYLSEVCNNLNINIKKILKNNINNINDINKKILICRIFSDLLYCFGCNLNIKISNIDNNFIEFDNF